MTNNWVAELPKIPSEPVDPKAGDAWLDAQGRTVVFTGYIDTNKRMCYRLYLPATGRFDSHYWRELAHPLTPVIRNGEVIFDATAGGAL